jgi:hypothetical protein
MTTREEKYYTLIRAQNESFLMALAHMHIALREATALNYASTLPDGEVGGENEGYTAAQLKQLLTVVYPAIWQFIVDNGYDSDLYALR